MKCVWASIDERGKIMGGKSGDQTGREVRTGDYYNFGQTFCIRPRSGYIADRIADCALAIANNDNVGYDQGQRATLYNAMAALDWKSYDIKKKCECDCSELAVCCANYALKAAAFPASLYSGNIVSNMSRFSKFAKVTIGSGFKPQRGDIIVAPNKHVIICIGTKEKAKDKAPAYKAGEVYKLAVNLKVRAGAGVSSKQLKRSELTEDGQKHAESGKMAVLKKGTKVTCKEIKKVGSDIWIRIPSGWIAAFYEGKTYVAIC